MWKFVLVLSLALLVLGVFSWLASKHKWFSAKGVPPDLVADDLHDESEECCGQHLVCEKDKQLMAQTQVVYYDDEELDAYRHVSATDYDEAAIALFSEVFYSLRPEDVMGWLNSLRLREIELPEGLRDEALLIVSERRYQTQ